MPLGRNGQRRLAGFGPTAGRSRHLARDDGVAAGESRGDSRRVRRASRSTGSTAPASASVPGPNQRRISRRIVDSSPWPAGNSSAGALQFPQGVRPPAVGPPSLARRPRGVLGQDGVTGCGREFVAASPLIRQHLANVLGQFGRLLLPQFGPLELQVGHPRLLLIALANTLVPRPDLLFDLLFHHGGVQGRAVRSGGLGGQLPQQVVVVESLQEFADRQARRIALAEDGGQIRLVLRQRLVSRGCQFGGQSAGERDFPQFEFHFVDRPRGLLARDTAAAQVLAEQCRQDQERVLQIGVGQPRRIGPCAVIHLQVSRGHHPIPLLLAEITRAEHQGTSLRDRTRGDLAAAGRRVG